MFLAKLDADGNLDRYPYSFKELRRDHPNTSFPKTLTQEIAEAFGCAVVTLATPPAEDHTKNVTLTVAQVDGTWTEQYTETDASADEIAARVASKSAVVREQRDEKLKASDWTVLTDSPLTTAKKTEWETYRQALRDISAADGFPHTMSWPSEPS
jgi:hypothetical protein